MSTEHLSTCTVDMDAELNPQAASSPSDLQKQDIGSKAESSGPDGKALSAGGGPSGEVSPEAGPEEEGPPAKALAAAPAGASAERIEAPGSAGGDRQAGVEAFPASSTAAVSLGSALAALDRRDYATAKLLFERLGRKDAVEAIENAFAALDRKDFAVAQGLFEALTPPKGAAEWTGRPPGPESGVKDEAIVALPIAGVADAASLQSPPAAGSSRGVRSRRVLILAALALVAVLGASAAYGSRAGWSFSTARSEALADFRAAVRMARAPFQALAARGGRDDLAASLAQMSIRLDQMEHDFGARLDKLGERIDQNSSPATADIDARVEALEKQTAAPAPAEVAAKLDRLEKRLAAAAAAPASEIGDLTTRVVRLEKKAASATALQANPPPPGGPKQLALGAGAGSAEVARAEAPQSVLRNYSVEDVQGGVAMVDSRYGPREVAPGDVLPGAGRVLRIERRGGAWVVVTSQGVIAGGPGPY
jgi:hypothetical protein